MPGVSRSGLELEWVGRQGDTEVVAILNILLGSLGRSKAYVGRGAM